MIFESTAQSPSFGIGQTDFFGRVHFLIKSLRGIVILEILSRFFFAEIIALFFDSSGYSIPAASWLQRLCSRFSSRRSHDCVRCFRDARFTFSRILTTSLISRHTLRCRRNSDRGFRTLLLLVWRAFGINFVFGGWFGFVSGLLQYPFCVLIVVGSFSSREGKVLFGFLLGIFWRFRSLKSRKWRKTYLIKNIQQKRYDILLLEKNKEKDFVIFIYRGKETKPKKHWYECT